MNLSIKLATIALAGMLISGSGQAVTFVDVAQSIGLTETDTTFGASWADIDNDGRPDLWLGNHNKPAVLYRNDPVAGFVPYNNFVGLTNEDIHGAAFADFDNDGDQDLLVTVGAEVGAGEGPNLFFVNNNGQMVESAAAYGVGYGLSRARHMTWFDWNGDSRLDFILVSDNERPTPPQAPTRVFTYNTTTGVFDEEPWTLHDNRTTTHAQLLFANPILANDPALLLHHNRNGFPDFVYEYDSTGLTDATPSFAFPNFDGGRDIAMGDFDGDLSTDMFIVSLNGAALMLQQQAGMNDVTASTGIVLNRALYTVAADFDNDKDLDIYVVRSNPGGDNNQINYYYENNGNGTYSQVAASNGTEGTLTGFASGLASADYNNDGFMDLLVTNSDNWFTPATTGPIHLFENQGNSNNWVHIDLVGTLSNRDAIGARVYVTSGGVTQLRDLNNGIHHRAQNHKRLHFGLGSDTLISTIDVHWPNGDVQSFSNLPVNRILTIHQSDPATPNSPPVATFTASQRPNELIVDFDSTGSMDPDGILLSYLWNFGDGATSTDQHPTHTYSDTGDYTVTLTVTDDLAATSMQASMINLQVDPEVEAVGSNNGTADNLLDENPDGSFDLSTAWTSSSQLADAWFTLDLGVTTDVVQVLIAPRGDHDYELDISVSDTLSGGKATGGVVANCSIPGGGAQVPSDLFPCNVPLTAGRYVTVQSTNRANFRVYAVRAVAGSAGNLLPLGSFTATPMPSTSTVAFDGSGSVDADGNILQYNWNFGDGNTASGPNPSHAYSLPGTYPITLTLIDDGGGSSSLSAAVTLIEIIPQQIATTVSAVGATSNSQNNIDDLLGDGNQNLGTKWENLNGIIDDAWFTVDLGASHSIAEVRIAPRGDRQYVLDVVIGDSVNGAGQVTGGVTTSCTVPSGSTEVPSSLYLCPIADLTGRYITVESQNRNKLPVYGIEVYETMTAMGSNVAPQGQFTALQTEFTLNVDFDASASSDSDGTITQYVWDFGEGGSATGVAPSYTYATDADYVVSLTVTDDDNAVHVLTQPLSLTPLPDAPEFTLHPLSQTVEVGDPVTFSVALAGTPPINLQWQANGVDIAGETGTSYTSVNHNLADDGTLISVVATNAAGSRTSNNAIMTVIPANIPPTAVISLTPGSGFAPLTVTADAGGSSDSDGTITSYSWDLGDGTSATGVSVNHVYATDGTFTVQLTVTDDDGDSSTSSTSITVDPPVLPSIVTQPQASAILVGESATFTVSAIGTPTLTYQWRRNGADIPGATASSYSLINASTSDDGAQFSVTVSNAAGSVSSNAVSLGVNTPPSAAFTATPLNAPIPFTASFDASGSNDSDGNLTDYSWDFGDGTTGSGVAPSHQYTVAGVMTVTLTITDDDGATASTSQSIIANAPPLASFTLDQSIGLAPLSVNANAASSSDPDGSITSYAWDFGDGNSATGQTTSHTFAAGTWTLSLTVTDNDGATHTTAQTVIANVAPSAAFTQSTGNGLAPLNVDFDASTSSDSDDGIASYHWDFGDGNSATGIAPSHQYTTVGVYTVTLTVTDTLNATDTATSTVIANAAPVAEFTLNTNNALVPFFLSVDGSGSTDSNGTIESYAWDFGDGTTATGSTATHTYNVAGTYVVTLTVTDNNGASSSSSSTVIANLAPTASFTLTPETGVEPLVVNVDGSASSDPNDSITNWSWTFGDGGSGQGSTASHTYVNDGTYVITLAVTDEHGATDITTRTIVVDPLLPPSVDTPPQSQPVVLGATATFSVGVSGTPPFSYQWRRDGAPISGATSATYSLPNVSLSDDGALFSVAVTNAAATVVSAAAQLSAIEVPSVTAGPQSQTVAVTTPASFDVTATGTAPLSYQWRRNGVPINGATGTSFNIASAELSDDGSLYDVVVSNIGGSATSAPATLNVFIPNQPPVAAFSSTQPDNDLTFSFDASASTDSDGSITGYAWDFGDGNSASGAQVSHTFSAEDSYTITLTVTDNLGASGSDTQVLTASAFTAIEAVGTHGPSQDPSNLLDTDGTGAQDLSTFWQDNGSSDASWITFDLGASKNVVELLIAPRGDKNTRLDLFVGDNLTDGQVDGPVLIDCEPPRTGSTVPSSLSACPIPPTIGRYLTVSARSPNVLRVYGAEVLALNGPVNQPPQALFSHQVVPDSRQVDFDGSASSDADGSVQSWAWDFGDGSTDTGPTPSYTYSANGTYTVVLTVTDDAGATSTTSAAVSVDLSVAMARSPVSIVAVGNTPSTQANIIDENADGTQRLTTFWDNEGNLSTAWFTLDLGATRNVQNVRVAPKGNRNYNLDIRVSDQLAGGQASGGANASCATPGTDSSTPTVLVTCDLGGLSGRYVTVASLNRANYRVHGVEVWVEDAGSNSPPLSLFSANQVTDTLDVDLDGSASTDVDGSITDWSWDFGDGNTGSGAVVTHSYASAGSYNISLTVTDDAGATDTASQVIELTPLPQAPVITTQPQNATVVAPNGAAFSVAATGTAPLMYQWQRDGIDIGGATSSSYTLGSTTLADDGALFTVTVMNSIGSAASGAALLTVTEPNTPPTAAINVDSSSGEAPHTVTASGSASSDPDGTIASYAWDFGDGGTGAGETVTYTYTNAGTWTLTLTVTDDDGATASSSTTITVTAPPQAPQITGQPSDLTITEGADATFSVTATGDAPLAYQWFRDAQAIAGATASSYTLSGAVLSDDGAGFSVSVSNGQGSVTSSSALLTVEAASNEPERVAVTVADIGARAFRSGDLIDELADGSQNLATFWNSGGSGIANAWFTLDLGSSQPVTELRIAPRDDKLHNMDVYVGDTLQNGQVDSPAVAQCSTPDNGSVAVPTALVSCAISNANGRYLTVRSLNQANFRVYGVEVWIGSGGPPPANSAPTAALSASTTAGSLTVDFDASASTDSDGTLVDYAWDFGDGSAVQNTSGATISHSYGADGTYTATLTVTDDDGASDAASTTVTVTAGSSGPSRASLTVAAAGRNLSIGGRAIDTLGSGEQDLGTFWHNGTAGVSTAWITVDLGSSQTVTEVRVAPRDNRAHNLDITVGDTLLGDGQVDAAVAVTCSMPGNGSTQPSDLRSCALAPVVGRYVSVKSRNFSVLRMYGLEAWVQ